MDKGGIGQAGGVDRVWKEKAEVGGRIETIRYVKFADGVLIQDREKYPYFDFNMDNCAPASQLGYRIWWYGCQRCEAWRQVIREILIEEGDLAAFKFAMSVLILWRDRWMDFFVCEDCVKLRKLGIRRDPLTKMFVDWGPEGAYPPPIHEGWRDTAANMNRFGEGGLVP
ncbi:MAG: hypothetical protein K9J79_12250 [Desulfobacteraceae bacterium]|nr:hypothetical protein [Desulfobacteraceae bacterium]MCF8096119.1 hypothetical protein [Desulfobacteraceae bacterium]